MRRMLCWQLISSNKCISDFEDASSSNEPLLAVTEASNPQEKLQGTDPPEESVEKLWKNKRFCCDACRQPGDVHFRVSIARLADWILVCETCWPNFREQAGIAMEVPARPTAAGENGGRRMKVQISSHW